MHFFYKAYTLLMLQPFQTQEHHYNTIKCQTKYRVLNSLNCPKKAKCWEINWWMFKGESQEWMSNALGFNTMKMKGSLECTLSASFLQDEMMPLLHLWATKTFTTAVNFNSTETREQWNNECKCPYLNTGLLAPDGCNVGRGPSPGGGDGPIGTMPQ